MRGAQWRVAGQPPSRDRPTRGTLLCHGWCPPSSQPRLRQRFRMWRERQFRRLRRLPCAEYQRDSRRTGSLRGARHRLRLRRALRCMPSRERGRVSRHSGRGRRPDSACNAQASVLRVKHWDSGSLLRLGHATTCLIPEWAQFNVTTIKMAISAQAAMNWSKARSAQLQRSILLGGRMVNSLYNPPSQNGNAVRWATRSRATHATCPLIQSEPIARI